MNRREFGKAVSAVVLTPMIPTAGLAATATAPAHLHNWAVQFARAQGRCSPELLSRALGCTPQIASSLNARLFAQGVLAAPNAIGVARTATPAARSALISPKVILERHQKLRSNLETFDTAVETLVEGDAPSD